ncbi:MAG: hypothetical protein IPK17_36765 [Chloroflexi bacterium]|uniref:hypothetical protein n=1 Tax=Candidatus Flexifilum breve TaxID=3140694 RepID=UPI0031348785|nr:hypothetical protein [Chloroflexota bacterium]
MTWIRWLHDTEQKMVLGHKIPAGRGIEDALHVLGLLAVHPRRASSHNSGCAS